MDYQFDRRRVADWKSHLLTEGFVVITGMLDKPQIRSGLANFIGQFGSDNFDGFIDDHTFVYSDFSWSCRTNLEVLKVYQQIYNLESPKELLTAIDRGTSIPNVISPDTDEASAYWLHVDYPLLDVLENQEIPPVYQSFLSFVDSGGSNRPGLRVVPRSATKDHHNRILEDSVTSSDHEEVNELTYWVLSDDHIEQLESSVVPVISPAGSLTLWLSGLIHDNTKLVTNLDQSPLARLVIYLCYVPKSWATADELQLRESIYKKGQITTHWPTKYISLHDDTFQRWAWRQMANRYPIISDLIPFQVQNNPH